METLIRKYIFDDCQKLIDRYYFYLFELEENIRRKSKRLGQPIQKTILRPNYWDICEGFDPFKVRNSRRLDTLSYTINKKIKLWSYKPHTAITHQIPKESGGFRELNIFQISDAAISKLIYKSLLAKNVNLFSGYAYAYREDKNAHDAIKKISSDWNLRDRVYVAEFDFSKFFDNISHDFIWKTLESYGFLYTDIEGYLIKSFLESNYASESSYNQSSGTQRKKGIPQGTSISLFLANVACWELDQELEGLGVRFSRYADDTLIWSNSYEQVVRAYDIINYFSTQMNVPINFDKSEGITLISERNDEELKTKSSVRYLGYNLSLKRTSISQKSINHTKEKISYIIYENLLQPLKKGVFNLKRVDHIDWDYVTALSQIRRYLYGGLNDQKLRRFRLGIINNLHFHGFMSYYPLVEDEKQLKNLDGWLIHTLQQTLHKRQELWLYNKGLSLPGPCPNWIENIANLKQWKNPSNNKIYDLRIPSFLQINRTIRVGLKRGGINSVTNPKSRYYPGYVPSKNTL